MSPEPVPLGTLRWHKTLWGALGSNSPHATMAEAIPAVAAEGWDGVVYATVSERFDPDAGSLEELSERCADAGLDVVVMVHTWGTAADEHLRQFDAVVQRAAAVRPRHIVAQCGLDAFTPSERSHFFAHALEVERACGVRIAHETHRMRPLFSPWATRDVLGEFPDLWLALDLSHWVVVAERLLADGLDIVAAAAARTVHLDARVGHEEGPQVPDPADPQWATQVEWFTDTWRRVVTAAPGPELVVVPEYGPPPYLQTVPFDGTPVTDLWALCRRERDRLRAALI
jgi:sugar phosphate isomerase/epimerase